MTLMIIFLLNFPLSSPFTLLLLVITRTSNFHNMVKPDNRTKMPYEWLLPVFGDRNFYYNLKLFEMYAAENPSVKCDCLVSSKIMY